MPLFGEFGRSSRDSYRNPSRIELSPGRLFKFFEKWRVHFSGIFGCSDTIIWWYDDMMTRWSDDMMIWRYDDMVVWYADMIKMSPIIRPAPPRAVPCRFSTRFFFFYYVGVSQEPVHPGPDAKAVLVCQVAISILHPPITIRLRRAPENFRHFPSISFLFSFFPFVFEFFCKRIFSCPHGPTKTFFKGL